MLMLRRFVEEQLYFIYIDFGIGLLMNTIFHVSSRHNVVRDSPEVDELRSTTIAPDPTAPGALHSLSIVVPPTLGVISADRQ